MVLELLPHRVDFQRQPFEVRSKFRHVRAGALLGVVVNRAAIDFFEPIDGVAQGVLAPHLGGDLRRRLR